MEIANIEELLDSGPAMKFHQVLPFNGHQVGAAHIEGVSPGWEMHPDTDELFYVLQGEVVMVMAEEAGLKTYKAGPGEMFVVPRGLWHKPGAPDGAKIIYLTPGESLTSEAEDPR